LGQEYHTQVFEDNIASIEWSNNVIGGRERAKHIDIQEHFAHEVNQRRAIYPFARKATADHAQSNRCLLGCYFSAQKNAASHFSALEEAASLCNNSVLNELAISYKRSRFFWVEISGMHTRTHVCTHTYTLA
jgi:hypothetical protein